MFAKVFSLAALLAVAQSELVSGPHYAHSAPAYSSAHAVSSQSIVRHDEQQHLAKLAVPVAKVAVAPVHYAPAPVAHYAPAPVAHYAPAPVAHYAPAPVAHYAHAPAHYAAAPHHAPAYSSAHAVSSQNIVRHEQPAHVAKLAVPVAKYAVAAPLAHYAPAPVHHGYAAPAHEVEAYSHPKYDFEYKVNDPHTGDNKSQQESRDGDVVHGSYSLVEADGSLRTVEYTADAHHGFNAVVSHSAPAQHVVKAVPVVKALLPAYHH